MMRNCALPKDPYYPANMEKLDYFINDIDEIRWIDHPTWYFKYFITKNERHNIRHREAFNTAVRSVIYSRLEQIGMIKYLLSDNKVEWESPYLKKCNSDPDTAVPHIPIYASKNVGISPRVLVLFGESFQDLGILAQRIICMKGGINAGSVISFIQHINATEIDNSTGVPISARQTTSMEVKMANPEEIDLVDGDTEALGIILANTGQLRWCRSEGKAMTFTSWNALTRPSAVDECVHWDALRNSVPGHRNISQHVDQILTTVIPNLCGKDAKIEFIAIADSCEYVPLSLDRNWSSIAFRMQSLALINPDFAQPESYTNPLFKTFLLQRSRGFVKDSTVPANTPMFGPSGGAHTWQKGFGYNIYSIPDESADESIFPRHFLHVLEWQSNVASDPKHCEDELTIKTFGDDTAGELGANIDTRVKTVSEIEAEMNSGHEQRFLSADFWDTPDGVRKITRIEDEVMTAKRISLEESPLAGPLEGEERIKTEDEKWSKDAGGIGALEQVLPMNTETKTLTDARHDKAMADVKAVNTKVANEAFKETKAQPSKTKTNSTQNTNVGDIPGTSFPPSQTQTQAVTSNNDAIFESLQDSLPTEKKRDLIDLLFKPVDLEDAKGAVAEEDTDLQGDTEVTALTEKKKSIFELQGFGYHEMSAEDQDLGFTRYKWLTDEEAAAAEKEMADADKARKKAKQEEKKARVNRLDKAERKALLNAQIEPRKLDVFRDVFEKMTTEGAVLLPTVEDTAEICSKTSVEKATRGLIEDMMTLDIASHSALPATPQGGEKIILKVAKPTPMNEIFNDEDELPPRQPKLEKQISFDDYACYKTSETLRGDKIQSFDGANDDDVDFIPRKLRSARKPTISLDKAAQKKLAASNRRKFEESLRGSVCKPAVNAFEKKTTQDVAFTTSASASLPGEMEEVGAKPSFEYGGDGTTNKDAYLFCPPERMERLPSMVAKTLHTGMPEVKLSKDEKAAILQITVLSSPVKEGALAGEGKRAEDDNRKISVVTLDT